MDLQLIIQALITVAAAASPFVLKFVPAHGKTKLLIAYGASAGLALLALALAGRFESVNWRTLRDVLGLATAFFGAQQLIFNALKERFDLTNGQSTSNHDGKLAA